MDSNVNIGELDTLVTLISVTPSIGSQGQKTVARATYGQVYAKVEPTTDEYISDDNLEARTGASVTIYKVEGLSTRWEVVIDSVSYAIRGIDPISRLSPFCVLSVQTIEK